MRYLDHNSTTPIPPSVHERVAPFLGPEFGNPSSASPLGARAKAALETAREELAQLVGAASEEVVFTSGGTESCFAAITGTLLALPHKRHMIISAVEHPAVVEAAAFCRRLAAARVTVIPVRADGGLDPEHVFNAIEVDTALISIMTANNETGVVFPIAEIAEMAHSRGIIFHTDATQAVGKSKVDFRSSGVDLLSLSGHKFGAAKGCGALVVGSDARWEPVVRGGGQERGRRGGTESLPLIASLGAAAALRREELAHGFEQRLRQLRDSFEAGVRERIPGAVINGAGAERVANTSSISFDGLLGNDLVAVLAAEGIYISAGAACKTGTYEPSSVLRAMGRSLSDCLGAVRISFGSDSSSEDVAALLEALERNVAQLRSRAEAAVRSQLR